MAHLTFRLPGGALFSSPKSPELPPLPPVPTRDNPELEAARRKQLLAEKRRRGIVGTILTSGLGDISEPTIRRPTLG